MAVLLQLNLTVDPVVTGHLILPTVDEGPNDFLDRTLFAWQ